MLEIKARRLLASKRDCHPGQPVGRGSVGKFANLTSTTSIKIPKKILGSTVDLTRGLDFHNY